MLKKSSYGFTNGLSKYSGSSKSTEKKVDKFNDDTDYTDDDDDDDDDYDSDYNDLEPKEVVPESGKR